MSEAELLEFIGWLFWMYATGWGAGKLELAIKRAGDQL